ncbi:hypothetical protein H5410_054432 [Solanum commersonii]|uniref:Uncharacterized protein n=1 Tax=Solanum commersonii TaxID=4109 RepID=A0A9J5WFB0_SOLCO|nr:hypothetical protein H5410_054432 [Solanum commersonii]
MYDINTSIYISNSLLGEYFNFKWPKLEKSVCRVVCGFCFSDVSRQYKLVKSVTRKFGVRSEISELEVYTFGVDKKWRNSPESWTKDRICIDQYRDFIHFCRYISILTWKDGEILIQLEYIFQIFTRSRLLWGDNIQLSNIYPNKI